VRGAVILAAPSRPHQTPLVSCLELALEGEVDGAGAADLVEGVEQIVGVGIPPPGFL
jgi:hypothetical protein